MSWGQEKVHVGVRVGEEATLKKEADIERGAKALREYTCQSQNLENQP